MLSEYTDRSYGCFFLDPRSDDKEFFEDEDFKIWILYKEDKYNEEDSIYDKENVKIWNSLIEACKIWIFMPTANGTQMMLEILSIILRTESTIITRCSPKGDNNLKDNFTVSAN